MAGLIAIGESPDESWTAQSWIVDRLLRDTLVVLANEPDLVAVLEGAIATHVLSFDFLDRDVASRLLVGMRAAIMGALTGEDDRLMWKEEFGELDGPLDEELQQVYRERIAEVIPILDTYTARLSGHSAGH